MSRDRYGIAQGRRRSSPHAAYDALLYLALALPLLVILGADILAHWPAILSGKEVIEAPRNAAVTPNYIRNFLELTSFLATTAVIVTALVALILTLSQVSEARDARIAAIYVEINKTYNSPHLMESRRAIKTLRDDWKKGGGTGVPFGTYVAEHFMIWSDLPVTDEGFTTYNQCMRMMQFWEDVGVLVRRTLVELDVVLEFHMDGVLYAGSVFGEHLAAVRAGHEPSTVYANALWLMEKAQTFQPYEHPPRGGRYLQG